MKMIMASTEKKYGADSFVREVAQDHAEEVQAVDTLLAEITQANRRATHAELCYFSKNLNWDESDVKRELRRMHSVLRLQSIAGGLEDRQAAAKEAETSTQILEKEGVKVADQIAKLQAKLASMERDQRLAVKRVEDQSEAVKQLRELCPEHIRKSVNDERGRLDSSIMRQIQDAQTRTNELECCLTPSRYPSESAYLEALERSCREAVHVGNNGRMIRRQLSPTWPSIRDSMETELQGLRDSITALQEQYDAAIGPIESKLDYYAA
jgi:hypothetical protein